MKTDFVASLMTSNFFSDFRIALKIRHRSKRRLGKIWHKNHWDIFFFQWVRRPQKLPKKRFFRFSAIFENEFWLEKIYSAVFIITTSSTTLWKHAHKFLCHLKEFSMSYQASKKLKISKKSILVQVWGPLTFFKTFGFHWNFVTLLNRLSSTFDIKIVEISQIFVELEVLKNCKKIEFSNSDQFLEAIFRSDITIQLLFLYFNVVQQLDNLDTNFGVVWSKTQWVMMLQTCKKTRFWKIAIFFKNKKKLSATPRNVPKPF